MENINQQSKQYRHLETKIVALICGGFNSVKPMELTEDAN